MYNSILVPIDGSSHSEKALSVACDLANKYTADLHIIYASNYLDFMIGIAGSEGVAGTPMISQEEYEQPYRDMLALAASAAAKNECASVKSHFVTDSASKAILKCAQEIDADLIVIGSKGHGDFTGLILGSVSHRVLNSADCSCLIVR